MKFLKTYIFFFLVFSYTLTSAQTTGDFRSFQDGNWNDSASWEYFDGSSWVSPPTNTNYPGDGIVTANDVSIISNHTINLNISITNTINSVTIGDQNGAANSISTLLIGSNNGNNNYTLETQQLSILYDGLARWGNNHTLILPATTSISIEQISPYSTTLGIDYGLYDDGTCNTQMQIQIGSALYANCNGNGGSPSSFEDINNGGGNLSVSPTSPSPVCLGTIITLTSNPNGTEYTPGSDTFTWTAVTVPAGHIFTPVSSTAENTTDMPSIVGTYTYQVEIDNGTITSTGTVTIVVNPTPDTPTGNTSQFFCSSTIPTIASLTLNEPNLLWYTSASGGASLAATTPLTTNTFYASQSNGTCESTNRLAVNVKVSRCNVITNRRITYRVKK